MLPDICRVAFKEWAVAVRAMARGEQILLLRKGGIREEGKSFRVMYPDFLLYPTFEHQQEDLLKEPYHQELRESVAEDSGDGTTITFSQWAKVEEVIELAEGENVDNLFAHHIWTRDYAQKRLHWKPRYPLSIMLLRLYQLGRPETVPYLPYYGGCKSWVELPEDVRLGRMTPVLTQDQFMAKVGDVKEALEVPHHNAVGRTA